MRDADCKIPALETEAFDRRVYSCDPGEAAGLVGLWGLRGCFEDRLRRETVSVGAEVVAQSWEDPTVGTTDDMDALGVELDERCPELLVWVWSIGVLAEVVVQFWDDRGDVGTTDDEVDALGVVLEERCPELLHSVWSDRGSSGSDSWDENGVEVYVFADEEAAV
jgi:hypothetical protein